MSLAFSSYSNGCCGKYDPWKNKVWIQTGIDVIAAISLITVGILGATGVITMSPAASYGMIIAGGVVIAADLSLWIPTLLADIKSLDVLEYHPILHFVAKHFTCLGENGMKLFTSTEESESSSDSS
ncbi:MAG: hypothetical protein K940chlam9_00320 [Chlamydiae bacterium]|nr:hypothetical protein [Chlamydiota bacterium]